MIVRQAFALGSTGAILGLAAAIVASPVLAQMVQETHVTLTLGSLTAALVIGIVLLAAWLPARRAARIEPTLALRIC